MKNIFSHPKLKSKMGKDIAWNMASMIFVAVAGLVYNTIFVVFYSADVFGLYNQALVYFLIFSQIAVFGIHFSILKYASEYAEEAEKRDELFSTALISTLITSVCPWVCYMGLARLYIVLLGRFGCYQYAHLFTAGAGVFCAEQGSAQLSKRHSGYARLCCFSIVALCAHCAYVAGFWFFRY